MCQIIPAILSFVDQHPEMAAFVVFLLAASESIVVIGAFVPGTVIILALSTLIGMGHLSLLPILFGAVFGAIAGDGFSWWVGHRWRNGIAGIWPFSRHPHLIADGQRFFDRHGGKSILLARFTPGVRAIVAVLAGALGMPPRRFFAANVASALAWAPVHVLPGALAGIGIDLAEARSAQLVLVPLVLIAAIALVIALLRWRRR